MKTNHRRNFKAKPHRDQSMFGIIKKANIADKVFSGCIGNDFTNGHRGAAKSKRGAKKFVRTRIRFHDNNETKKSLKEYYES